MEVLWSFLVDTVAFILEALIPSKEYRRYKKNLRILKKQYWFRKLAKTYSPMFYSTASIQAKIMEYDKSCNLLEYRQELEQKAKTDIG
ncbi:hypothetical protein [Terribacillus saccharophilus]|uniref:hypothetical protein n=1 Tax=Terribacillus saccharophilus TaxID=361277 RepID=UPI000BA5FACB|nr:hypothetical protein [Terribacillus saccharophilus]PAF18492.1 hypothetical protein CHH51_07170 [Terribacillus saccharophilus]